MAEGEPAVLAPPAMEEEDAAALSQPQLPQPADEEVEAMDAAAQAPDVDDDNDEEGGDDAGDEPADGDRAAGEGGAAADDDVEDDEDREANADEAGEGASGVLADGGDELPTQPHEGDDDVAAAADDVDTAPPE